MYVCVGYTRRCVDGLHMSFLIPQTCFMVTINCCSSPHHYYYWRDASWMYVWPTVAQLGCCVLLHVYWLPWVCSLIATIITNLNFLLRLNKSTKCNQHSYISRIAAHPTRRADTCVADLLMQSDADLPPPPLCSGGGYVSSRLLRPKRGWTTTSTSLTKWRYVRTYVCNHCLMFPHTWQS